MMIAVGVLLVSGIWDVWMSDLRSWAGGFPGVV
jgi:hypothetical protein